jgi:hypothetical protein
MSFNRFIIYFILFNLLLATAPLLADFFFSEENLLIPKFWLIFSFFSILTFNIYVIASWRMRISNRASGQALLGSITVKLLLSMIVAFVYIRGNTFEPINFITNFFYLYFFHTVFEIYCLLCTLHNQKIK